MIFFLALYTKIADKTSRSVPVMLSNKAAFIPINLKNAFIVI